MKRVRLNLLLSGSATVVFSFAGLVTPGCEAVIRDPQAFFADDPCNVFNCDNLTFLRGNSSVASGGQNAAKPDTASP